MDLLHSYLQNLSIKTTISIHIPFLQATSSYIPKCLTSPLAGGCCGRYCVGWGLGRCQRQYRAYAAYRYFRLPHQQGEKGKQEQAVGQDLETEWLDRETGRDSCRMLLSACAGR